MDDFQDRSHYGFFIHYFATPPASPIPSLSAGFFCRHSKYSPEKWIRRPRNDSFAGIPNILQRSGFVDRETIRLPAFQIFSREVDSSTAKRFICRYPVLSAHGNGGIGKRIV